MPNLRLCTELLYMGTSFQSNCTDACRIFSSMQYHTGIECFMNYHIYDDTDSSRNCWCDHRRPPRHKQVSCSRRPSRNDRGAGPGVTLICGAGGKTFCTWAHLWRRFVWSVHTSGTPGNGSVEVLFWVLWRRALISIWNWDYKNRGKLHSLGAYFPK